MHNFTRYVNPHLGSLLEKLKMDKEFTTGKGHYLYDSEGNSYLDFIAAYGALPFGFNHPEIWQALNSVYTASEPSFVQPSALGAAGELAKRLIDLAPPGLEYVTFTNSGTEAVEAAIKMARSCTGRMGILSTVKSFHGKTLGALSATGSAYYQSPFGAPVHGFKSIPFGDLSALKKEIEDNSAGYAAFIVEPIQGEGGIIEPPPGYLPQALELCRHYGILFIVDEIQSGLGRTGRLFACEEESVCPDLLLLAKALGGGLYPIGACLCTADAYTEEFGNRHSSTFAANTLGCRVGLKVLDMLTGNNYALINQVRTCGDRFKRELIALQSRFPHIIKTVRGRGYMLGLEFEMSRSDFPDCFLSVLSEQECLTPFIAGYLLNVERLRVAPTLNGNRVIRLEPPLTVGWEECSHALRALNNLMPVLDSGNTAEILRPQLNPGSPRVRLSAAHQKHDWDRYQPSSDPEEGRFAFLVHTLDINNYVQFDPSLASMPPEKLKKMNELNHMMDPFVIGRTVIRSKTGKRAYGDFITIPYTAKDMLELQPSIILEKIEQALDLAVRRGARIAGLGAYTSVVSRGGTFLQGRFLPLTTGNSYTVVAGAEAVKLAAARLSVRLAESSLAVVGATGSIGRSLVILVGEEMNRIILVGNARHPQASSRRMRLVGADLCLHLAKLIREGWKPPAGSIGEYLSGLNLPAIDAVQADWLSVVERMEKDNRLVITTEMSKAIPHAQVVITATNSVDDLINPEWVAAGAIICDISKPPNVRPALRRVRPDVLVIDGGIIAVPGRTSLGWNFGFEHGLAYACMAETMMLALEHNYTDKSLGAHLTLEDMIYFRQLAVKHGFELAQLRSFDKPLAESDWLQVVEARAKTSGQLECRLQI